MSTQHNQSHGAFYKDDALVALAEHGNVAQFASYSPRDLSLRHCRLTNNIIPATPEDAILHILHTSPDHSVNIRSFDPLGPRSRDFIYGLTSLNDAQLALRRTAEKGLYTIVNETVDVSDGGVSGVYEGGIVEFASGDTPRCVEGSDVAALPYAMSQQLFHLVYGVVFDLPSLHGKRIEFSVHPQRRGVLRQQIVLWELEGSTVGSLQAQVRWPNRFSRIIGDKAYGLLIAHLLGLPVPRTRVIPRKLPDFEFGVPTATGERWLRTCPTEQIPGKYTTSQKWIDPFALMHTEDPDGAVLASVLSQDGVEDVYSGALLTQADGTAQIEGRQGGGEAFMVGLAPPEILPALVRASVIKIYEQAKAQLGPVRMEWVYDGLRAWVVQLHSGISASQGSVVYPGEPSRWHRLAVARGLDSLRALIADVSTTTEGIILEGHVGVTSHMADVLRKARIPSRIESSTK